MLMITTDRYSLVSSMLADVAAQVPALQAANPPAPLAKHPLVVAAALFAVRAGTLIQDVDPGRCHLPLRRLDHGQAAAAHRGSPGDHGPGQPGRAARECNGV
jgi:hypothetical protein